MKKLISEKKNAIIAIVIMLTIFAMSLTNILSVSAVNADATSAELKSYTLSELGGGFSGLSEGETVAAPNYDNPSTSNIWAQGVDFGEAFELTFNYQLNSFDGNKILQVYLLCDGDNYSQGLRFDIYPARNGGDMALILYSGNKELNAWGFLTSMSIDSQVSITLGYSLVDNGTGIVNAYFNIIKDDESFSKSHESTIDNWQEIKENKSVRVTGQSDAILSNAWYIASFDPDNGQANINNKINSDGKITIPEVPFKKDNDNSYYFEGWFYNDGETEVKLTADAIFTKNVKITAKYTAYPKLTTSDLGGGFPVDGSGLSVRDWDIAPCHDYSKPLQFGNSFELSFKIKYNSPHINTSKNFDLYMLNDQVGNSGLCFTIMPARNGGDSLIMVKASGSQAVLTFDWITEAFTEGSEHTINLGYTLNDSNNGTLYINGSIDQTTFGKNLVVGRDNWENIKENKFVRVSGQINAQLSNSWYYADFNANNETDNIRVKTNSSGQFIIPAVNPVKETTNYAIYTFNGWFYKDSDQSIKITENTVLNKNTEIFAEYTTTPINYTVTFDTNGGSDAPSDVAKTYHYGDKIILPQITKHGEKLVGWYYEDNQGIEKKWLENIDTITENITLKAKWAEVSNITFVWGDGLDERSTIVVETGTKITELEIPSSLTKTGYIFGEWLLDSGAKYDSEAIVTEDITVNAKWLKQINVVFKNGDLIIDTIPMIEGDIVTALTIIPTKDSSVSTVYTFDKWYIGSAPYDFTLPVLSEDITLIAHYKESVREYTLTIKEGNDTKKENVLYNASYDLSVFEKEGYSVKIKQGDKEIDLLTISGDTLITLEYTKTPEINTNDKEKEGLQPIVIILIITLTVVVAGGVILFIKKRK